MALDGITLHHLIRELAPQLTGARIDKVTQPEKEEIHLQLRSQGQSYRLLLNISATAARLHLSRKNKKNPVSPPMFCMILRKHIEGGKILKIEQLGLERIILLSVQNYNEYGDLATLHLYLEIMGKHSNLILVDPQSGAILDGLKRYSHALSRHREVLPGRQYIAPPSQGKLDPLTHEEEWREVLFQEEIHEKVVDLLVKHYAGISPELAREIVTRAGLELGISLDQCGDIDLSRIFQAYTQLANPAYTPNLEPTLYYLKGVQPTRPNSLPTSFSFLPFQIYQGLPSQDFPTLAEAVENFYQTKASNNTLEAKRGSLRKITQEHLQHLSKKRGIYEDTIANAGKGLKYQRWGELLTANLYRLELGMKEILVEDYNEETLPKLTIPLEAQLTGIENSQRYYRLYNKAKATIQKTTPLQKAVESELIYLNSVLLSLEQASTPSELDEVHKELIEQDYLSGKQHGKSSHAQEKNTSNHKKKGKLPKHGKDSKKSKSSNKPESPQPKVYFSSQNHPILVGKNNRQNDWLTLKKGRPQDLWLHTKNIPGSHVLIPLTEGEEFPDDATLEEAAALAIHFSQAKGSTLVPVDYTHVKNIKKPNAAKPGMVIYDTNWTLYLTPKEEIVERLLASEAEDLPLEHE
ncbi:putative RNA-binding protein, snRNP like protein [Desulfitobacterium dichloroeliminans LMG P-21439]|uniref:Rqc2 homolog RqcH n=1 Tax=Desulfitobacterium dichloroeliminans (strain LMG P-21439 / DCA1) TaxID=871963 RepID=L0FAD3_DESDL|nr:NFACT RNA binding domain-containing protein [Desulfitobacterium dichloroeliminans]AGA70172.1 putative RNA-binding protein, snRNP like protein [Desulfitobacterium dichloroeliminans LMG P-21439]